MFKSKFSKVCALLLVFGILFSTCSVSYADGPVIGKPNSIYEIYNKNGSLATNFIQLCFHQHITKSINRKINRVPVEQFEMVFP